MPNSTQKEQPENPLDLTPRERATRFFRVAQRVKKKLLEIKKVNLDLSSIPKETLSGYSMTRWSFLFSSYQKIC